MFKKISKRIFPILLVLVLLVAVMPMQVFAGNTVSVLDGKITITDTANSTTVSDDIVTVTAKGGLISQTTNTLTIKNNGDSTATISFSFSASNYKSFSESTASGSKSFDLVAGETATMSITGKRALSSNTATLTLSNFVYQVASSSSNATLYFDMNGGSVTAEGTSVTNGEAVSVEDSELSVVATAASGYSFYAWVNAETREILSSSATYSMTIAKDVAVEAVFSNNSTSKAYFYAYDKNKNYIFDDLSKAGAFAASSSNKTIVLMASGTLPAADHTIPAGVTLLIPFDDAHTLYTTSPSSIGYTGIPVINATANLWTQPYVYSKLTMESGANIDVNGAISLSAKHAIAQGAKKDVGGAPSGPCSYIYMNDNTAITVNSGASLYAWGFIYGNGSVTAKSGANIYENFQIADFRGGTQSTGMENGVFPMSQYYIQNIEVPLTIEAGAKENCYTSIFMQKNVFSSSVAAFSSSDAMFNLTSGFVTKVYDGSTDRLIITLGENSEMTVSPISMKISTSTIDSDEYELPINGNISITAKSGSKVHMEQDIAMLPGSVINLEQGSYGELKQGTNIYIYDKSDWGNYTFSSNESFKFIPLTYAPGKTHTRTEADLTDATVKVNGTFDATNGYIYTTIGGANIYSTGTGVIKTTAGTQTVTHQLVQNIGYTEIPITPAVLQNESGVTPSTSTDTYTYIDGKWICTNHIYSDVVTDPNCSEQGYTTHTCGFCDNVTVDTYTDALGHTFGEWIIAKEPTYSQEGSKTHTCLVCGHVETAIIEKILIPDIDGDGDFDSLDLVKLRRIMLNIDTLGENVYSTVVDLNCDGCLNILDLIRIKKLSLSK